MAKRGISGGDLVLGPMMNVSQPGLNRLRYLARICGLDRRSCVVPCCLEMLGIAGPFGE